MTLVELVVAMVVAAIVVAGVAYFVYPVRQSAEIAMRAELTDIADNALQRIARDVRLALPNSVRVDGTGTYLEFLEIRTAGRYRAEGYGTGSPVGTPCVGGDPDSDQLVFDTAVDDCFKPIGPLQDSITTSDRLVLNNYGPDFDGQNAYADAAAVNRNWRQVSSAASGGTDDRVRFTPTATAFNRDLHDSSGKRFFIVSGPVSYGCALGEMRRYAGYAIAPTQPVPPAGGSSALIAENVESCTFDYEPNVAPQIGLLTLRLTLAKARSDGTLERVSLYHAVHVSNVP